MTSRHNQFSMSAVMMLALIALAFVLASTSAFRVMEPPYLAGIVQHVSADWGPPIGAFDLTVELVVSSPLDACAPLTPPTNVSYVGKAILVLRGSCSFALKAFNVYTAGAAVMALGNSDPQGTIFPMMTTSTAATALSFMISFTDYTRLGAALSHTNTAQGFDVFCAALDAHLDAMASSASSPSSSNSLASSSASASASASATLPSSKSASASASPPGDFTDAHVSSASEVAAAVTAMRAALVELRRTQYGMPRTLTATTEAQSAANVVVIRTTTVGESLTAWQLYWSGFPNGDSVFGDRPWVFWMFPITLLIVMQMYCCMRCVRSGLWSRFQQRFGLGGGGDAANGELDAPPPAAQAFIAHGQGEVDEAAEVAAAVAAINASEARAIAALPAGQARAASYGAVMATLPASIGSLNGAPPPASVAGGAYARLSDVEEKADGGQ